MANMLDLAFIWWAEKPWCRKNIGGTQTEAVADRMAIATNAENQCAA